MKDDRWCENCEWWGRERAHKRDWSLGTCRAIPPYAGAQQVLAYHDPDRPSEPGPLVTRGAWLWTAFDDWCGSFAEALPPPAQPDEGENQ